MRASGVALCASALIGGGALLAGCGGVPGNAVATVDGDSIPQRDYTHWLAVFTKESAAQQQQQQQQQPTPKPTAKQLRDTTLQFLLSTRWLDGEAAEQGIKVSSADVKKSLDEQKKQSFPQSGDYEKYLKSSGQTEQDLLQRVRVSLISNKISTKVGGKGGTVSDQAVADFYAKNEAQFVQPEKRDLRVVLTKEQGEAQAAYDALKGGDSWKAVTSKYSIDEQSKATGGKLPAQAKGSLGGDLDDAVFKAEKNELSGPLKTQYGYFVFQVTGVTPSSKQSLADAKDTIRQTLQSQSQQKAVDRFVKDFTARWRDKTQCSAGYRTSDCKNGPKPTPTPSATQPGGQTG